MRVHELGHLVLYVRDLDRSRRFYREVLGWDEVRGDVPLPVPAAAFSSSGRTHHELLLIEVGPPPRPCRRAAASGCTTSASRWVRATRSFARWSATSTGMAFQSSAPPTTP